MASKTNCVINGKAYYRLKRKIGEDEKGKTIYKTFYGDGKKDAEKKAADYFSEREQGIDKSAYFGQLMHYFIYNVMVNSSDLAEGSIERYECVYRNYLKNSDLRLLKMSEISSKSIQKYYNGIIKSNSQSIVKTINKVLNRFFKYAETDGYCRNPLTNVVIPREENTKLEDDEDNVENIEVFTDDEIQKIIASSENERLGFFYLLAIGTGMRLSELIALKYDDITDKNINVTKQFKRAVKIAPDETRETTSKITEPKSSTSNRVVPLPSNLKSALQKHKLWHEKEMLRNGYRTEYIFTSNSGKLLDKGNLRRAYKRYLARIEVEYKKFHSIRATYCTMLCRNGVAIQVASKLMGHSDISVTMEFYTFISDKEKDKAAKAINKIFK